MDRQYVLEQRILTKRWPHSESSKRLFFVVDIYQVKSSFSHSKQRKWCQFYLSVYLCQCYKSSRQSKKSSGVSERLTWEEHIIWTRSEGMSRLGFSLFYRIYPRRAPYFRTILHQLQVLHITFKKSNSIHYDLIFLSNLFVCKFSSKTNFLVLVVCLRWQTGTSARGDSLSFTQ